MSTVIVFRRHTLNYNRNYPCSALFFRAIFILFLALCSHGPVICVSLVG
jgi:hypothetical protein